MKLSGKNYVVAGGSRGIGLAVVKQLLAEGASVTVLSRNISAEWGTNVNHIAVDFSQQGLPTELAGLPETIHGAVYAPGSITLKPFHRLTEDDFFKEYRLNVFGAALFAQWCMKGLKKSGTGSLILYSTVAAKVGMGFHASIASAKAAVEGLGRSLAAEWASANIRVNMVAPSLTDTDLASALLNTPEKREASNKRHPLGRVGTADDLANATLFLLSEESAWMSGQTLQVDGGMSVLK